MKTKDIAAKYRLSNNQFDRWLTESKRVPFKSSIMGGLSIDNDADVEVAVRLFEEHVADRDARAAEERAAQDAERAALERAAEEKRKALASMLITSGFNFDGYTITKYSGYISGDDVVQIDRGTSGFFSSATNVGESLMNSLSSIRRRALAELKEAAYDLGCNAVIGVDFDYLTLDPETASSSGGTMYLPYVFGVTANGNAVVIEKK